MRLQKGQKHSDLPKGVSWSDIEKLIEEKRFKKQIQKLSNETLNRITKDSTIALKYAKEGIEKFAPENLTDEIFKEQNAVIEDKIMKAQVAKDDAVIEKYNIDRLTSFIKTFLADLGERSDISQLRVLLGSIFPAGLFWNYDGIES